MLAFAIFAVTFVVALIVAVLYFYPGSAKRSTIPGMDPSDQREGNLPDLAAAGSMHEFLIYLHEKYGPIASFWFGPKFTVSIASPELFKEHIGPFDRPPELFALFEPMIGKNSIQYTNKSDGRSRRNIYDAPFGHESLKYFYETFNELANELVKKLSGVPKDEHLPLVENCHAIVIKGLTQTSFGDYFKDDANIRKFCHSYGICWDEMEASLTEGLPEEGSDRDKKFKEALAFLHGTVRDVIKQRQENPTVGHQVFIDVLIENELPESQILDDCISFMVGGFHTSGHLLAWAIYFLATHKKCQEKLYQEIKEIIGSDEVEPSHLGQLKYLRQVLDESLRVSVLAPYAARFQDNESELGGHVIPPGTPVMHALGVVLQDKELWPEPKKFDPERFSAERMTQRHRDAFKPFGFAGKRICPGQHFSYTEVSVFLAILFRAFTFSLVPGQVVEPKHGLVTSPKEEIWVTLEKRD
ncbi:cytochrome P450 20A1-like [Acanthaster planci]|uniref:Cytochrome P450 20A1-like n=1 Tax=Acanthaster planci TaxID=133434 RepID=A0A8B7ZGF0_ACAPL|nr:cytochrome P450 20A1-like [Acanthaster planci]XP_022102315.1 cytochrome P450 20A1-like [Acanthaster planci]XP_022102316.1 cytochrome P450 20A1-like [Acanthaster planci]XP_022102318.1 cytochrome P450 20A1-like [Acanthaster planci]XP_022102319.1 cytochrome P450 20A1-like [Acanthaster planci]XP_022102320.1 cytochrome P450 20A1-like [Acanthaster planci]